MQARSFVAALVVAPGLVLGAAGAGSNQTSQPAPERQPLSFDRTFVDLGAISDRDARLEPFRFTNVSGRNVRLTIGGCHFCGVPTSDKPEYKPGESGVVLVDVNPANRRGTLRAGGTVGIEGLPGYHQNLDVIAEVRPLVWMEPEQITLHDHPRGEAARATFRFCTRSGTRVEQVETPAPDVQVVEADAEERVNPDDPADHFRVTAIELILPGSLPVGTHDREAIVRTSDPASPSHTLTLRVHVVGDVFAEPSSLMVGEVRPGQAFMGQVRLRSRSGVPVRVEAAEPLDRELSVAVGLDVRFDGDGSVLLSVYAEAPRRSIHYSELSVGVVTIGPGGERERLVVPVGYRVLD